MEFVQNAALVLIAATAVWIYMTLRDRLEFLEHEVRWLRRELDALKPGGVEPPSDPM